jgi:transposase
MGTAAFSLDLRERIVELFRAGTHTAKEIARTFKVGRSTVYKYVLQEQKTGDLKPIPRLPVESAACNNPIVRTTLLALVQENNDSTLAEYCDEIDKRCGIRMSVSSMCVLLKNLNQRRKKKTFTPQNEIRRKSKKLVKNSA